MENKLVQIAKLLFAKTEDKRLESPTEQVYKLDSWVNTQSGFGGTQHATNITEHFRNSKKQSVELSSLYEDDWACRKGVDMPADDSTRKGITFLSNDDDENSLKVIEDLDDILTNKYSMLNIGNEALKFSRLSGGNATFFNFGGTEEDQRDPIEENQIKEIKWIRNFPAWLAIPVSWYTDFNDEKLGQPEHYQLNFRDPSSGRVVTVHESRLLIMQGRHVTPQTKALNRGWNDSNIQVLYNALRDFQVSSSAASGVMEDFNWFSLGIKGLADKVMHDPEGSILERIYLARQKLHSGNLSLYDADGESMERHGTPVTGLDGLWDRFGDIICAAFDTPRSLFFSSESGDLGGNSAESDRANYYDRINSGQEVNLRPWINNFIKFISLVNKIDDSKIKYIFNPIKTKTDKERHEEELLVAQKDQIYLQENVITSSEVAESRFSKSKPDLDTMNLNKEERDAQGKLEEFNQENEDTLKELEIESNQIDNDNKKTGLPDEKPEEKKDSAQIIEVKPIINIPEIKIPEIKIPTFTEAAEMLKDMNSKLDKMSDQEIKVDFE